MNNFIITLYTGLSENYWQLFQIIVVIVLLIIIKKLKISGIKIAYGGFILLILTMICNIFLLDALAGKIAEFVWILFTIAFVQQFYHFLKHENK